MNLKETSTDAGEVRGVLHEALFDHRLPTLGAGADATAKRSTPLKRTAASSRTARLRLLELAVAELSDIVIVTEADIINEPGPRIVYVNAAFERQLGYTAAEALGRSPRFLQGAATQREPLDRIRRALSEQRPVREELANYTKSGELILLALEIIPIFDDAGACTHFVSIERNVSEQRAVEEALRVSEERFSLVSRATNDAVFDWDVATDVVWWGEGFEELFGDGGKDGRYPGVQWASRVHEDDRDELLAGVTTALTRGDPGWHAEYRFRHANGEYVWVSARGYIVRDAHGTALRMIGGMTDISDRRGAEEQLRLLAAALDVVASPVAIVRLDAHVRWVNRAFCELTGYAWDDAVEQHMASLILPPSADASPYDELWSALLRGETWSGEVTNERRDSIEYPTHVTITPVLDADGRIRHFVALLRDLTESRRHEAHLLRTQRVESIGTLASGIAHDLNNVLSPIMLSVDYLRDTESDPERMEAIEQMEVSAKRGAALLRQLLLFARVMDGHRVPVNAGACIKEIASIARNTFPPSITLRVNAPDEQCLVLADATQLHQVLMNLCVNARDAMPAGGTLTLETRYQIVDEVFAQMHPSALPGRYTVFVVTDTGSGMTADVQAHLFEPFFTSKPIGEGTGLGLSTAFAIVRGHGGFIQVTSAVGKGSRFAVYFPVGAEADDINTESYGPSALPRGNGELVLVVDDEAPIRMVAQRSLERFGYRVITAEHGADAVAQFARQGTEIAVVLLDMLMPILDGPSTILALKALDPNVRIIATSGVASNSHVAQAARAGVKHFVQKPFAASELLMVLAQSLAQHGGKPAAL